MTKLTQKASLFTFLSAIAYPAIAQVSPATGDATGESARADSLPPDKGAAKRADDSRSSQNAELTYESPDSTSPRALHYRLDAPLERRPLQYASEGSAARAADAGLLAPYTLSPRITYGQSWVRAVAGYDTAAGSARSRSATESAVTSFFAVRFEYEHGPATGYEDRVSLGGRFQVLNQQKHGIDVGLGAFYRPRDFRGEGNVVGAMMLARNFGRLGLFGSALFGSDPEGDDQDIDGQLSTLYRISDIVNIGWDNHIYYTLSTDAKRFGTTTTDWEVQLEPTVTVTFGPVAILTEAGFSALQTTGPIGEPESQRIVRSGLIAMAGAGGAF